jgi:hypothetical protein
VEWTARLYRDGDVAPTGGCLHFVGAPPSGRFLVVCEAFRDGGVAPTGTVHCILWEPRHRGDSWWSAGLFATGASLLQGQCTAFCGSPALGAILGGVRSFSRRGRRAYRGLPAFCGSPALGAILGGLRSFSRRGRRSYRDIALDFVGAPPSGRWVVVCVLTLRSNTGNAPLRAQASRKGPATGQGVTLPMRS